ncbi:DUF411 domain-containing protein [Aliiruegeria sabulilitoris]|uniref:DUF411 domain-containing protein n=1 Tax=Aliiruegeria sabulilitoris TaxID=1510458 RepID=UPI00082C5652|nr:DUF411 domain-containing protein [Aliiruegeria sabulilitoris]NDR57856.1 metal-binding protein [Pseudoruegeria sp. M32A2M]
MKKRMLAALMLIATPAMAAETVTVYRDPSCGCCELWADHMADRGYDVKIVDDTDVAERAMAAGVPEEGLSCHHAEVGGYQVHGHVPEEIIARLLDQRPSVTGIVLPGMPENSPGMAREKYGTLKVYSYGPGGIEVYSNE